MTNITEEQRRNQRKVHAYNRMMERVKATFAKAEDQQPALQRAIDAAKDKAVELGELSREEADRIGEYLHRDLIDAGEFLARDEAEDLSSWLQFDIELIEERLAELFLSVADQTTVELEMLAERAHAADREYRADEITAMGTFECLDCGEQIQLTETAHIPACPKCGGTRFRRVTAEQ
jgi:Zn finger protein HypA/HybF involved in hydrogenase expression